MRRILVLGGARSGKSVFAERLARECGEPVLYVATATATDAEMAERIRVHQARRPMSWRTLERARDVSAGVAEQLADARTLVVEDLTLLLSNLLEEKTAPAAEEWASHEVVALLGLPAHVILVSNEVGMGLVPAYPIGRVFRDGLGRLNQLAAARAEEVYLLVAGLPLRLKPSAGE